jgi:phage shock protein A
MTLRLLDRIATLVRADAHGMGDALEERSLLLKQALRDAELALLERRARLDALEAETKRVAARGERRRTEIEALDADVALALGAERDELARFAIRKLLPLRREIAALDRESASLAAAHGALAEEVAAQEAELEELRARVRARLATPNGVGDEPAAPPVDEAEVELELLRRRGALPAEESR